MFTGIVEEQGMIVKIQKGSYSAKLTVAAERVLEQTRIGDSIAVNGVCLTVVELGSGQFTADVMHETLNSSSLGRQGVGAKVNLERAMAADGRFGGHIVSGHIDGIGTIAGIVRDDNAVRYRIATEDDILRLVVYKGSIAIDGISLTISDVTEHEFEVSVIPHTQAQTTLANRRCGDIVNLENDVIGKYVQRLLAGGHKPGSGRQQTGSGGISREFLLKNGML